MNLIDLGALLGLSAEEVLSNRKLKALGKWTKLRRLPGVPIFWSHSRDAGVEFQFAHDKRLTEVFLKSEGHEKFSQFWGELVGSVTFADDQKSVRKKLGKPAGSRKQVVVPVLGMMGACDHYVIEGLAITFVYSLSTGTIQYIIVKKQ